MLLLGATGGRALPGVGAALPVRAAAVPVETAAVDRTLLLAMPHALSC